jgi:ankyrin repeat protein
MIRKVTPEEEFNLLLTMDIDLEAVDQDGNTALHLAVIRGQEHTAQALLQSGANVNAQNAEGKTALMIAIESFSAPLVQLILKQDGVELELTDALGDTALNVCARTCPRGKGYLSVDLNVTFQHYFVRELAAKGAEINTQNAQGDTPLHQCGRRKYGKTALYAILKQLGADDTIRNNEGKRPFCRWYYDPLWNMYGLFLLPIPYFATAHAANALGKGKWWV